MKPTKVKDKKKSSGLRNGIVITGVILIVCIVTVSYTHLTLPTTPYV